MLCTGQYNSATIAGPAPFIWRRVLSSWARELGRSGQWYVFGGNFIQKITEIYKILSYKGHIKDLNVFWIEACPNRSCLCSDCSLCRMIWFVRSSNLRIYGIGFCLVGHGNWVGRVSGMFLVATSSKKSLKFIKSYLTKDISKISTSSGLRPVPTVLPLQGWQLVQKDLVRALLEPPDIWRWILSRWAR